MFLYLMYYCRTDSFLIQLYMYFYYDILGPICAHYKIPLDSFRVPLSPLHRGTTHTTTKWKKTSVRFLWHHPGNPTKIPGQLLWNPRCKRFSVSAPQYRKFQQLKKAWQPCPTECQEGYRSSFPRERAKMQPCTVYRERELVRRREEKRRRREKEKRENSGLFKRVELGCARLFWEWCLVCLYSTIYAAMNIYYSGVCWIASKINNMYMCEDSAVLLTEASNHIEKQNEAWRSVESIDLAFVCDPVSLSCSPFWHTGIIGITTLYSE